LSLRPLPAVPTRRSSDLVCCGGAVSPPRESTSSEPSAVWVSDVVLVVVMKVPRCACCRCFGWSRSRSLLSRPLPIGHRDPVGGRSEEHTSELQSRFDLVC